MINADDVILVDERGRGKVAHSLSDTRLLQNRPGSERMLHSSFDTPLLRIARYREWFCEHSPSLLEGQCHADECSARVAYPEVTAAPRSLSLPGL